MDYGGFSSLAFNSLGQWGIAYSDFSTGSNAFRGIPAPGATELFWTPIESSGSTAFLNSLGHDLNEESHVSYGFIDFQTTKAYIKHAEYVGFGGNCGGSIWRCDTIVETSPLGFSLYNSLFFIYNLPNIAYRDINQHLSVATYIGDQAGNCGPNDSWICWVLDGTTTVNGSISTYTQNETFLGIAYVGSGNVLHYAEYVSSGGNCGSDLYLNAFRCISIDTIGAANNGQYMGTSLGLVNDAPVIAYTNTNDQDNSILKIAYQKFAGNCGPLVGFFYTWQCDVVDNGGGLNEVGYYPSLRVNSDGVVSIAYYDYSAGNLKFAVSDTPVDPTPTPTATPGLVPWVHLPLIFRQ